MNHRALIFNLAIVICLSLGQLAAQTASWQTEAAERSRHHTSAKSRKKTSPSGKKAAHRTHSAKTKAARTMALRRARRLSRAFVASADLRPMARQLLQDRTGAAYAGVEAYARKHAGTDAGALAWLAAGYAHILDKDYAKAVAPLKRAQAHAGEFGDYVAYFLATAYSAQGMSDEVAVTLREFNTRYPDSLLVRDAMLVYGSALVASNRPAEAVRVLEKYRLPARSDYEFTLGRAYLRTGSFDKAAEAFKRVYYAYPLSAEAHDAKAELDKLVNAGSAAPATFAERKSRADLLAQARRNADAAREYRMLLDEASPADRDPLVVALGVALHRSGNNREARPLLESVPESSSEMNALRLLALAEIARSDNDEARFNTVLDRLRQTSPASESFEQALMLGGNMALLRQDYDKAIDFYRELQHRFPLGKRAAYAHWKAAWLSLRQGRKDEAKKAFEEQVANYPAAAETPAAIYWRARLAEEDGEYTKARSWYQKLSERFRNYYYSELARARLANLTRGDLDDDPVLARIPPASTPAGFENHEPPADNVRVQKSMLLQNGGLTEFAIKELKAAASNGSAGWASMQMARFYQEGGRYDRALQVLKRAIPSYYSLGITQLPRPYWEALFPRPYWTELKKFSLQNDLDPFLVASLIRQESEFNPGAVSRAEALGLMQLLPATGKKVARELRVARFSAGELLSPNLNLQLGTRYFRNMINQFGKVEYALAAYNAGADRVQNWLASGNYRDTEEFVESIPFTETREYVQAIMRNAAVYRRLYGTP